MNDEAKPVELECGHKVWLKTLPDTVDDTLYCVKCDEYREIAPATAKLRGVWVTHPDLDFRSMRVTKREFIGECLFDKCEYVHTTYSGWFILRDIMHKHYMRTHTKHKEVVIEYVPKLPPGSPPPF